MCIKMVVELIIWNKWTVDNRLRQFRKVEFIDGNPDNPKIQFIDFDSKKGMRMLDEYRKEINK